MNKQLLPLLFATALTTIAAPAFADSNTVVGNLHSDPTGVASISQAGGNSNWVSAYDYGQGNRLNITQVGSGNNASATIDNFNPVSQNNQATIKATGNGNFTTVDFIGSSNNVTETALGNNNNLEVMIGGGAAGTNNTITTSATGNGNTMQVETWGSRNTVTELVAGDNNRLNTGVGLTGFEGSVGVLSNNNSLYDAVSGSNNVINEAVNGSGNFTNIHVGGDNYGNATGDKMTMNVTGNSNGIAGFQYGSNDTMNLTFRGNGNTGTFVQIGNGLPTTNVNFSGTGKAFGTVTETVAGTTTKK